MPGTLKSRHHNTWTGRLTGQRLNVSMSSRVADKDDPRPKAACVGTMKKLKRADKLALQLGRCRLPFTALRQPPVDRWTKKELGRLMVWARDRLARVATMHGENRQFLMDDDYFTHLPPEPLRGWVLGAAEKGTAVCMQVDDADYASPEYSPKQQHMSAEDFRISRAPMTDDEEAEEAEAVMGCICASYPMEDLRKKKMEMEEMHHPIPLTPEEMNQVEDSINACRTKMGSPGRLTYNGAVKAHLQLLQRLIERVTDAAPPSQEELKDMGTQWQDLIYLWCRGELRRLEQPELNEAKEAPPDVLLQWMKQQEASQ